MSSRAKSSRPLPFGDRHYRYDYLPVRDDSQNVAYGLVVATNVTERHAMEAELRRTTERFTRIFRVTPDPLLVTTLADGTILEETRRSSISSAGRVAKYSGRRRSGWGCRSSQIAGAS